MNSKNLLLLSVFLLSMILTGCSQKDEPIRMPDNILGVWSPNEDNYLEFSDDNTIHHLKIEFQDGESIGWWETEVYYYEPGYNLVIYITAQQEAKVYEIVSLSDTTLTWCPVDEIDVSAGSSGIGHIIGDIIKKAQEGYKLDPGLYETFHKISQDKFLELLESLDLMYPW